ncbi:DUF1259 domain-containing protein [Paenibacillus chibensis]|uniref:DUF1259 domain-containing protein n=1 Tax=Paenibacillus chibensis TaxID=59846 RepID=A0ABU6PUL4_9BACL|nr:DUF1259 domain-containing protein [Paenibacillus chibensis]
MKKLVSFLMIFCLLLGPANLTRGAESPNCRQLENIFKTGVKQEDGICRLEFIRKNIPVSNLGIQLLPETIELAFGANFQQAGNQSVVIGEFALLVPEVNRVIDALRKGNIEVSAVHNHMIGENPQIIYLHFQGRGDTEALAATVKAAIGAASSAGTLKLN